MTQLIIYLFHYLQQVEIELPKLIESGGRKKMNTRAKTYKEYRQKRIRKLQYLSNYVNELNLNTEMQGKGHSTETKHRCDLQ